jgi:inhibitor of cysteine peptidase
MKTWMKWTGIALAGAVAALAVAACGSEGAEARGSALPPRAVELTVRDSGKEVQLHPGQEMIVTLESNASTGFRWVLVAKPDSDVLKLAGSEYVAATTDLLGAPGEEVWTFEAVAAGKTALELSYQRASGETSGQAFKVSVQVAAEG